MACGNCFEGGQITTCCQCEITICKHSNIDDIKNPCDYCQNIGCMICDYDYYYILVIVPQFCSWLGSTKDIKYAKWLCISCWKNKYIYFTNFYKSNLLIKKKLSN